jgi:hypothetical protein
MDLRIRPLARRIVGPAKGPARRPVSEANEGKECALTTSS